MKQHIKRVILSGTKWSRRISILSLFAFIACTDYVQNIEDQRDEWREEQAQLLLSSEEQDVSSSSTTSKESSGSKEVSSSTTSDKSSNSVKSDSTDVNSSSSTTNEKTSSSKEIVVFSSSEASSSSVTFSGSSVASSSSSEVATMSSSSIAGPSSYGKESWAYLNSAISYGEIIDNRDGQIYKTIVIGEQEWMAENLNFEAENSYCFDNKANNCNKYGRLYIWSAAMDSIGNYSSTGKTCGDGTTCSAAGTVQGICPPNWHLPDSTEWAILSSFVGGSDNAGTMLKTTFDWKINDPSTGWIPDGNGTNAYGFSAVPAGALINQKFGNENGFAFFWCSGENGNNSACSMILSHANTHMDLGSAFYKNYAFSVRCIKNNSNSTKTSSSSENAESSSSLTATAEPCKTTTEDNCEYGTLEDTRDGHTYKTVKIGTQWWMAENLSFETDSSYCYKNDTTNCAKYGKYYTWGKAMSTCPTNWHLPQKTEWDTLFAYVGGSNNAGLVLKSTSGWNEDRNGTDAYGFTALPAGQSVSNETYQAYFWSSTESSDRSRAFTANLNHTSNSAAFVTAHKRDARLNVRCVKN